MPVQNRQMLRPMNPHVRLLNHIMAFSLAACLVLVPRPGWAAKPKSVTAPVSAPVSSPAAVVTPPTAPSPLRPDQPQPGPVADTPNPTPASSPSPTPAGTSTTGVDLPPASTIERYNDLIAHSPFAIATQPQSTPPPVDGPPFARDLVLVGVVRRTGNDYYIMVASRDQSQHFGLGPSDTYNGISVATVAWSDGIGKTKVTLKRGNEYGVISFDEAVVRGGAVGPNPGTPTGSGPMGVPMPNGAVSLPAGIVQPNGSPDPAAGLRPPGAVTPDATATATATANPAAVPPPPLSRPRRIIRAAPPAP